MNKLSKIISAPFSRFRRDEDANITVGFVIMFPIMITMFMASFEIGLLMTRQVMLDRAVDVTIRSLRMGEIPGADQDTLRTIICDRASIIPDCSANLLIELRPVSTSPWADLAGSSTTCINRDEDIELPTVNAGAPQEVMLVRVCSVFDPIFPTSTLGIQFNTDEFGGYALVSTSAFVNEPS